ncbi:MAG: RdgB/HAM1 family non-canonical purine NTP pyrophosphatase [Gammaproteobacteria bacterium]|nr:MAG: RdgB/HAM1 family non-canonical purine NTP pyrophosphatase [Gammaproteobacteria bacterium]
MRIVLATGNTGKLKELQRLLAALEVELIPQTVLGVEPAEEPAPTFVENALLKARHASLRTGLPAIADDSGLVVDALGGAPGVLSARYAGVGGDDAAHNRRLLEELADVADGERGARFRCAAVYLSNAQDPVPLIAEGVWEGHIARSARGAGGFGYDPLFIDPCLGKTSAELSDEEKNQRSHRGQALRALVSALRTRLS